jgi:hypothetical protein
MNLRGVIYKVDMIPFVEMVNTEIKIWVVIPENDTTRCIIDHGTVSQLAERYGFEKDGINVDLRPMINRDCVISIEDNVYKIVSI